MKLIKLLGTSLASLALIAASTLPASAALMRGDLKADAVPDNKTAGINIRLDTAGRAKADAQIDARVKALTALSTRINEMRRVTTSQKASLTATLQAAITEMNALKAKIDADTDTATLKADIQSITKSYRIYLLVLPQGRITAAADRIMTTVGLMNDLSAKLQTRITEAQTAGQDVAAMNASLTDMNAKTADANVQANAAISLIANLNPDNGDQAVFQSNQAALKDARAKIKLATQDLQTARKDAGAIAKALRSLKIKTSTTTNTQVNQ